MRRVAGLWLAVFVLSVLVGWPARADPDPGAAMFDDATSLVSLGPRLAGQVGGRRGEAWVTARLAELGLTPERFVVGRREVPAIEVFGSVMIPARVVDVADATLLVTLPATAPTDGDAFMLLAHYDTVAGSPGAIDNAAAVSVGLELLRRLADADRPRDVMVAFTACEESGLAGARALADGLQRQGRAMPALALSLDLVGLRGGALTLNGLSRKLGAPWLRLLKAAADDAGVLIEAPLPHQVVSRVLPQIERSDHGVLSDHGVPAFHVYHRPPGRLYLDYHRRTDTMAQVDPARLVEVADFVTALATVRESYPNETGDAAVWLLGIVWPKWLMIGIELGLLGIVVAAIVRRRRRAEPSLGVLLSILVLGLAWGVAFAAELGVDALLDHPAPWAHAPGTVMLHLVLVAGLAARGLLAIPWFSRRPIGSSGTRTLIAAGTSSMLGLLLLLLVGVFELAWLPLLLGAGLAVTLRPGKRWAIAGWTAAVIPVLLVLAPGFVREASYNGFLPAGVPMTAVLAVVTFPLSLAAFDLAGRRWPPRASPVVTALLVALVVTTAILATRPPPCSADAFERDGLACERHLAPN